MDQYHQSFPRYTNHWFPGAGKTYFIIQQVIKQHIRKGFAMFIYDFKTPDLTTIAYNQWLRLKSSYAFVNIDFDDLSRSHRCNPLDPAMIRDVSEANEAARTILFGLNKEWKEGEFWAESSVNYLSAIIWYLKLYEKGKYCTLPHAIEMILTPYEQLFTLLNAEPQTRPLITSFINAFKNNATAQLEGQIAGVTISLTRLCSPNLYYILSGNNVSIDINTPGKQKIFCIGSNPQKAMIYGAVVSLFVTALTRNLNRPNQHKSSIIFDEFASVYFNGIDNLMATARSNKVATTLAVQDIVQLKSRYGQHKADTLVSIAGNVLCGQVTGETANHISQWFGKTNQLKRSVSINPQGDQQESLSRSLEFVLPPSKIASLSSGEFVGIVSDDPDSYIGLKTFYARIQSDDAAINKEHDNYQPLPIVEVVTDEMVQSNYVQVQTDIQQLVLDATGHIIDSPELTSFVISKQK
jgi:type IV secretory pathway TraG/TraD family ATPase VirD4